MQLHSAAVNHNLLQSLHVSGEATLDWWDKVVDGCNDGVIGPIQLKVHAGGLFLFIFLVKSTVSTGK